LVELGVVSYFSLVSCKYTKSERSPVHVTSPARKRFARFHRSYMFFILFGLSNSAILIQG